MFHFHLVLTIISFLIILLSFFPLITLLFTWKNTFETLITLSISLVLAFSSNKCILCSGLSFFGYLIFLISNIYSTLIYISVPILYFITNSNYSLFITKQLIKSSYLLCLLFCFSLRFFPFINYVPNQKIVFFHKSNIILKLNNDLFHSYAVSIYYG